MGAGSEPAAAAGGEGLRLRELLQSEQRAVERARLRFAAGGGCDLNVVDSRDRHLPRDTLAPVADEPQRGPKRTQPLVLVADDDHDILALVAFRLERSGYEVIKASDGAEALDAIRERLPDIAILDVMMPKLTGYEITEQLRADESTKRIPVILLTARVQEADVARGFESGADDYIKKPFSPGELQLRVQAILGRA